MKIETTRFGTRDIDDGKIIRMPLGMLGFPSHRQYVLLPHREGSPFLWYQSLEDPALAFVVTNPYLFEPDYRPDLNRIRQDLPWEDPDARHVRIYVVVNIPRGAPDRITANLIGPLIIHLPSCQAVQMVIPDSSYSHRFRLIKAAPTPAPAGAPAGSSSVDGADGPASKF